MFSQSAKDTDGVFLGGFDNCCKILTINICRAFFKDFRNHYIIKGSMERLHHLFSYKQSTLMCAVFLSKHSLCVCFLLTHPIQRLSYGNEYRSHCNLFPAEFSCDSGKGEYIVVLIINLVRLKFFVPDTDEIIASVPYKQIACKSWLGIAFHYSRGKIAIRRFSISISVVDANNIKIVESFFLISSCYICEFGRTILYLLAKSLF